MNRAVLMRNDKRASGQIVEHAISEDVKHLVIDVVVPRLRTPTGVVLMPWISITADKTTDRLTMAAGIRARRIGEPAEDDGV
jgi:hypothetical protein